MLLVDYGNLMSEIWLLGMSLLNGIVGLWEWLNEPIKLGFEVFGFYIGIEPVAPIWFVGGGLISLMIYLFIKALVPMA